MTKSLITLIGIVVSAVIVVLAAVFGVMPFLGQALTAFGDTAQAGNTNATYESQIAALQKEKARKSEIDSSVDVLRAQVPAAPDLDQAFDVIARSAQGSGTVITTISRGDLAPYAARTAQIPAGPAATAAEKAQAAPTATPTPQPSSGSDAVSQANGVAGRADANAAQTSTAAGAGADTSVGSAATPDVRQQIPLTVTATAPDMNAVQAFLDGLRGDGRLLGLDKVTVQGGNGGLTINLALFAFVSPAAAAGASK